MGFNSKLHNMESLDDIIEDANKNIKKVFLAGVAPEFRQEAYIIGLKLTLDRLAQELEFALKDDYSKPANRTGDRDFASQPNSPVLEPEKSKEMPAPMQGDWSVSKYFEMIKLYAIVLDKDLDSIDVKVKFISGLSPDNEKRVEEFGFKKPLKEIVKYLVRDPTLSTEIQKYKVGELKQGNESVREFYQKLERLRKLSGLDEEDLRKKLFCGLSPTNQDEVKSWGMYLPLDELIERLGTLEQLSE
ncbi:hypothetical protein RclHR1_27730003 [Rhizophagus clarus]|uniref:Retrotransposon gag domain-containing protein n=1 Tax=Rhizophagus clarus TaxID=94130 RepID=A0A2Z6QXZ6_9GLOM|nr:hypothetical protein RclHR1_12020008 [Rhizophagus clarus]GBB96521.1 hypothetical protein RclHR1_27730003 [Rhizophagus clarus]